MISVSSYLVPPTIFFSEGVGEGGVRSGRGIGDPGNIRGRPQSIGKHCLGGGGGPLTN